MEILHLSDIYFGIEWSSLQKYKNGIEWFTRKMCYFFFMWKMQHILTVDGCKFITKY